MTGDLFRERGDDKLEFIDPLICKLKILNQDPVTGSSCFCDSLLNCLIETFTNLEVVQLCGCVTLDPLLVEQLQLVKDVDRMSHQEVDR